MFKITTISPSASYTLDSNLVSVNEGAQVTYSLNTTGVQVNQVIPYTITGISSADLVGDGLNGTFTVDHNGYAYHTFEIAADLLTEGAETMTLTLNDKPTATKSTLINDTSTTPPSVPYNTVLALLHFDNNITNYGPAGGNWVSTYGGVSYSSTAKFGTKSVVGNYVSFSGVNSGAVSWNLSTGDYTIEFWMYPPTQAHPVTTPTLVYCTGTNGPRVIWDGGQFGGGTLRAISGSAQVSTSFSSMTVNQWHHVAMVRKSGVLALYVDGVRVSSVSDTQSVSVSRMYVLSNDVGAGATVVQFPVDEFRFASVAAYEGVSFAVPTEAFPNA